MPEDCTINSWRHFTREFRFHNNNPEWNASQRRAVEARNDCPNRFGSGGVEGFKRKFVSFNLLTYLLVFAITKNFIRLFITISIVIVGEYFFCTGGEIWSRGAF
jgi:hypothetical protein